MISALLLAVCLQASGVMKESVHIVKERTIDMVEYPDHITTADGREIAISADDIHLMEYCVMTEAGGESAACQEAVATVILNRLACPDKYGNTVYGVIFAENQFACYPEKHPTVSVRVAVLDAIRYYETDTMCLPYQCYYFRANHYHNFGIPYVSIDHTYFSLASEAVVG